MTTDDFADLDATACADLVRRGEVSPEQLVDAAIERIERLNPQINAVIGTRYERARAELASLPDGPLSGVPFLVKDLSLTMAGEPYHAGTRALKRIGHVAPADTYLATKFRRAGLVVLGRTNTPEWGSTITTEPLAYGPTRNPWNLDHSSGGSSGGSAAAVAAGMVPLAHGNDGGGSIRIPAAECGLVGLKPSRGRVSHGPEVGESWMGATIDGGITRSVRDAALLLDQIHGPMPGDPYTAPPPLRPYVEEVGADPGRLRIGFLDEPPSPGGVHDPDGSAAVAATLALLEALGHHVEASHPAAFAEERFAPSFTAIVAAWSALDTAALAELIGHDPGPDDLERDNLALGAWGRGMSAVEYLQLVGWMQGWSRRMVGWWQPVDGGAGFDLLVTPTLGAPPPRLGELSGPDGLARFRRLMQYTSQFNITGQPAISLPLWWNDEGLPIGVQLVAAPWREDVLLRVAAQLEQAAPWADRRPPVHA